MARRLIEEDKAVAEAFAEFNLKNSPSMAPAIFK